MQPPPCFGTRVSPESGLEGDISWENHTDVPVPHICVEKREEKTEYALSVPDRAGVLWDI